MCPANVKLNNKFVIDLGDLKIKDDAREEISARMCQIACKHLFSVASGRVEGVFQPFWKNGGKFIRDFSRIKEHGQVFKKGLELDPNPNRFVIDLGDFKLTESQSNQISAEMNSTTLQVLSRAEIDFRNLNVYIPDIYAGGFFGPIRTARDFLGVHMDRTHKILKML